MKRKTQLILVLMLVVIFNISTAMANLWQEDTTDNYGAYPDLSVQLDNQDNNLIADLNDVIPSSGISGLHLDPSKFHDSESLIPGLAIGGLTLDQNGTDPNFDITAAPIPASVWLLGPGLIAIIGFKRKLGNGISLPMAVLKCISKNGRDK